MSGPGDPDAFICRAARLILVGHVFIGLPILVFTADRPEYLPAYQVDALDMVLIALILGPGAGFYMTWVGTILPRGWPERLHHGILFVLLLLVSLVGAGWGLHLTGLAKAVAALALAGGLFLGVRRVPASPVAAWGLAGLSLVAPAYFLFFSLISPMVIRSEGPPLPGPSAPKGPVILVIFDALPLHTLLGPDGKLDAARVPAFARLGARATLYPNATCNAAETVVSIPSLLSGQLPVEHRVPVAAAFPDSLFRLLGGAHRVRIAEPDMCLAPRHLPGSIRHDRTRAARWGMLAGDFFGIAPPMLLRTPSEEGLGGLGQHLEVFKVRDRWDPLEVGVDRAHWFKEMVADLGPDDARSLVYAYTYMPHPPWTHLPDGASYPNPDESNGIRLKIIGTSQMVFTWTDDVWTLRQNAQRELLQVMACDRLLGMLLDKLEALGLMDGALVVVTADHAFAMVPGSFARDLVLPGSPLAAAGVPTNHQEIMPVPLLIKLPGQRTGRIDERNAELVDVLPTMAHALGVPIPWKVDGRSLLDDAAAPKPTKTFVDTAMTRHTLPPAILERLEVPARRRSWFAAGGGASWIYRLEPFGGLPGGPFPAGAGPATGLTVRLAPAGAAPPGVLAGEVAGPELAEGPVFLAFAAGGKVFCVTRSQPRKGGGHSLLGFYDPRDAPVPGAPVEVRLLAGSDGAPVPPRAVALAPG